MSTTNDFFPSNYLKASDLRGEIQLTMDRVERKEFDDGFKPILYFRGATKGVVLNLTNFKTIVSVHGDETDNWPGREVIIFPAQVSYRGQMVAAIRVKVPTQTMQPQAVPQAQQPQPVAQPQPVVQPQPVAQPQPVPAEAPAADPFNEQSAGNGSALEIGITDDDIPFMWLLMAGAGGLVWQTLSVASNVIV